MGLNASAGISGYHLAKDDIVFIKRMAGVFIFKKVTEELVYKYAQQTYSS
jgi:hypothetical protein